MASSLAAIINTAESLVEKSRVPFISAWYNRSVRASACRGFRLNTSFTMKPALSRAGARCQARLPEPMNDTNRVDSIDQNYNLFGKGVQHRLSERTMRNRES